MKKRLAFILLVIASFCSCTIQQPRITGARGFALEHDPNGNRAVRVEIRIDNPNFIGFKINDPVFEILLNKHRLGSGYSGKTIRVKAHSNDYHGLYISTDIRSWKDAIAPLMSVLLSGKINFQITGDMTARVLFWKKTFKLDVSENVSLNDLMK